MKKLIFILSISAYSALSASAQDKKVGGPCNDCAAVFESPQPFEKLKPFILLPGTTWVGKKPMGINGTVFKPDGKTPAAGIVLYIYETDETGTYPQKGDEKGYAKQHGYLRAWVRTDDKGFYKFGCLRPRATPGSDKPAAIHVIVKEPGFSPYYVDDYVFSDDPALTDDMKSKFPNRGGSGIIKIVDVGNMFKGERNIILGKNIPGY